MPRYQPRSRPPAAELDLLTAINTGRFDEAEAMLRENPDRIGPDGADTIALHLAVSKNDLPALRWLLAHGVAVNAKRMMWDCNHTALHMTVERGAMDIARTAARGRRRSEHPRRQGRRHRAGLGGAFRPAGFRGTDPRERRGVTARRQRSQDNSPPARKGRRLAAK